MSKNYCGKCGTKLDKNTGLCPKCDVNPTNISGNSNNLSNSSNTKGIPYKKIKKRGNHKEEKRDNNYSFGRRIRHLFFSVLLSAVLLSFIGIVVIGVLCYFDVVDVPVISYALYRSGVVQKIDVERDPQKDNYIPTEETVKYDANKKTYYADNVLLVVFDDSSSDEQISEVVDHLNGVVIGVIPELSMYQIKLSSAFSLDQIESIADDLMNNYDNVIFATYDSATLNANDEIYVPNDPWNKDVDKTDWIDKDVDGSNWWAEAIEARDAWEYNSQLSAIDVGISDSSFDVRHEDLKHKCEFPNELLKSRNVMTPWWHEFDFDIWFHLNKWSVSTQQNYHGTHVAGIIGAEGNNKKGITGLVQNGKILLAPMYPNENSGQYLWWDTSIYANLAYLVKAGAKVINYSQGKTNFLSSTNPSYSQQFLEREGNLAAIAVAKLLEQKYDFIVVQSAGNGTGDAGIAVDAKQNGWFSSITESSITGSKRISISEVRNRVVIVGAAEQENAGYRCTSFSNFGPQVDICAPGSSIYSTVPGELFYDFQFFGGYANECGTSMSAPIVTGVCALTWAANPKLTGEEVKNIVCQNTSVNVATNPNTSDTTTYNLVNAKLAVEASLNQKNESSTKEKGTTDTSLDEKTNPSLVPEDAVNFKGHYYYLYSGGIASSYEKALQFCNSKGGYLATITSKEENDYIYSYIQSKGCENAYFGLSDSKSEGFWEWCTGETSSYFNWYYGEPNDENPNEDYAMFYYKYTDGTWNDGDFGDSTVNSGSSFICEWGDYSLQDAKVTPVNDMSKDKNVVLTLDVSGSMDGIPLDETRKASISFINTILKEEAKIGVVTYDDTSEIATGLSSEKINLQGIVSNLYADGGTNIEAGLRDASEILKKVSGKKIIVLMSDGEPNEGLEGEDLIAYADTIKKEGIRIYTIGFFDSLEDKSYAQYLMEHIASDGCHYEVANADDLVFFFGDMADQINGQKYIYIRIACPVDVSVTYNGETLNSSEEDMNARTSFGTLTFEESKDEFGENVDERVKVLRLKEGTDYDLKLTGTGHGIMNYTIGFMDDNGEYSDLRRFEKVKITSKTNIDTVASSGGNSILNIDQNGDGKYDLRLQAEPNGYAEEIRSFNMIRYIVIAAGVLLIADLLALILFFRSRRKGR